MSTRAEFQEELDLIVRRIELLFGEVENALQRAVWALVEGDARIATQTITHDDLIDQLTISCEETVILLIARQSPVASDLRYLLSVLKVAADLERCGDLALRVAKQAYDPVWRNEAAELMPYFRTLGQRASDALHLAAQAWSDRYADVWRVIEDADVATDKVYVDFMEHVRGLEGPHSGEIASNAVVAGQALERIVDHAVSIGQRIRFLVTGEPEGLVREIAP